MAADSHVAPASDEELRAALDAIRDPCGLFSAVRETSGAVIDFRVVYANPAWARLHHAAQAHVAGALLSTISPRIRDSGVIAMFTDVVEGGAASTVQVEMDVSAQTEGGVFEVRTTPHRDGVVSHWRDVTARGDWHRSRDELQERLNFALDAGRMGIFSWEMTTDDFWWSDGYYRVLGYVPGAVSPTYTSWRARVHPSDISEVEREMRDAVARHTTFECAYRVVRPDGSTRWVESHGRVTYTREGEPRRTDGVIVDITERMRLEEDRRDSELRFRRLFEANLVGVFFYHEDGRILAPNDAFLEMIGVRRDIFERYGLDWRQITPPEWADSDQRSWLQLRAVGRLLPYEKAFYHADGHEVPVLIAAADLVPGRPEHGVAFIVDLTRLKRAEKALRDNESRLLGMTETLELRVQERTAEAERKAEQLRALALELTRTEARERQRLAQVLHDHFQQLVSAAKLKAGIVRRAPEAPRATDLLRDVEQLLDEALTESRTLAAELSPPVLRDAGLSAAFEWLTRRMERDHGLVIALDVDETAEPERPEIRTLLFEATRELLFNIVKHSGVNACRLTLWVTDEEDVAVAIEDRGRGFDMQAHERTTPVDGGMGLFGIRDRFTLIGGRFDLTSVAGEGTSVTLRAPRGTPAERRKPIVPLPLQARTPEWIAAHRPASKDPFRVLIADDHRLFREGLATLLAQEPDFVVVGQASDGQEAIDLARALRPDLLVLDIAMPRLNGVEVANELSREIPEMKIVGLSMHERDELGNAMRAAGASAYVTKVAPSEVLLGVLRSLASMRQGS